MDSRSWLLLVLAAFCVEATVKYKYIDNEYFYCFCISYEIGLHRVFYGMGIWLQEQVHSFWKG